MASPPPPVPCQDPSEYTSERVLEGLRYARTLLERQPKVRKVSPLTEKLLGLYVSACDAYLDQPEGASAEEIFEARIEINNYEATINKNQFLKRLPSAQRQTLLGDVVRLRQLEFYARYGDYAQRLVSNLHVRAKEKNIINWYLLSRNHTWAEIVENLRVQQPNWALIQTRIEAEKNSWCVINQHRSLAPTTFAIWETCVNAKLDFDRILVAINFYGQRNMSLHSGLEQLLEGRSYTKVAERLYSDKKDLGRSFGPDQIVDEVVFTTIISELIFLWFKVTEDNQHEPVTWFPTLALQAEMELRSKGTREEQLSQKQKREEERDRQTQNVISNMAEKLKADGEDEALMDILINPPKDELPDLGAVGRRGSGDLKRKPDGPEMRRKRSVMFDDLIKGYCQTSLIMRSSARRSIEDLKNCLVKQSSYHQLFGEERSQPQAPPSVPPAIPLRDSSIPRGTFDPSQFPSRPPQPTVPSGWVAYWDPATSSYCYAHQASMTLTWSFPGSY